MAACDVLSAISQLPTDIQSVIHGFHRLNEIESKQRDLHSMMVKHLGFYADSARYTCRFSDFYFADLDVMAETTEVFHELMDMPRCTRISPRSFVDYYGVDDFDDVACKQMELKERVVHQIEKRKLIE